MKMLLRAIVVLTSLMALFMAYLLYTPLPESFEEPWLYRVLGACVFLFETSSGIAARLTGRSSGTIFRELFAMSIPTIPEDTRVEIEDLQFDGVHVRLVKAKSLKVPAPCIIVMHGGGWILHSIDSFNATSINLALKADAIVVAVSYRLAPENPYPAPLEDCLAATKYVLQHGREHGIDVQRVAVLGDSAGGNIATATALRLAEENVKSMPPLKLHMLIYPTTQVVNFRTSSYLLYKDYPVNCQMCMASYASFHFLQNSSSDAFKILAENRHLTPSIRRPIYEKYFKKELIPDYVLSSQQEEKMDPFYDQVDEDVAKKMDTLAISADASPLLSPNLSKLPPTYMVVCEFDVLRDDGFLFAHRLSQAGVKVTLSYAKGQPHSFMYIAHVPSMNFKGADEEWDKLFAYLKDNL